MRIAACFRSNACSAAGSERKAILTKSQTSPDYTSNDLLSSLNGDDARKSLNYETVAQTAEEVQDLQNAPAISMGP